MIMDENFLDLGGPEGNVFFLIGFVKKREGGDEVAKRMMSGDYANAIREFKAFCPDVTLVGGEDYE